jgi:isochorismate hydrolase
MSEPTPEAPITPSSSTIIDELSKTVAVSKRATIVAADMVSEYKQKLRMAEEEEAQARLKMREAQNALSQAAIDANAKAHDHEVTDEDRLAFEKRWADYLAQKEASQRQTEVAVEASTPVDI